MPHRDTVAVHGGEPPLDREDGPITPAITVGSASGYPDLETLDQAMAGHRGYGRWGTENHRQLEAAVAHGMSEEEILEEHPGLEKEDFASVYAFAAEMAEAQYGLH